jgi:hypothetical protein
MHPASLHAATHGASLFEPRCVLHITTTVNTHFACLCSLITLVLWGFEDDEAMHSVLAAVPVFQSEGYLPSFHLLRLRSLVFACIRNYCMYVYLGQAPQHLLQPRSVQGAAVCTVCLGNWPCCWWASAVTRTVTCAVLLLHRDRSHGLVYRWC